MSTSAKPVAVGALCRAEGDGRRPAARDASLTRNKHVSMASLIGPVLEADGEKPSLPRGSGQTPTAVESTCATLLETSPDIAAAIPSNGDPTDQPVYVHDLLVFSLRSHLRDLGEELDQTRRVLTVVKVAMGVAVGLMFVDGVASSPGVSRAASAMADRVAASIEPVATSIDRGAVTVVNVVQDLVETVPGLVAELISTPVHRIKAEPPKMVASSRTLPSSASPVARAMEARIVPTASPPAADAKRRSTVSRGMPRMVLPDLRAPAPAAPQAAALPDISPSLPVSGAPRSDLSQLGLDGRDLLVGGDAAEQPAAKGDTASAQVAKVEPAAPAPATSRLDPPVETAGVERAHDPKTQDSKAQDLKAEDTKTQDSKTQDPKTGVAGKGEAVAALSPRVSGDEGTFAEAFKSATRMLERRLTPEERAAPIDPQYLDAVLRIEGIYDPTRIGPFGTALRMAVRPGTASMRNVFGDSWTRAIPDPNVHYRTPYYALTWMGPKSASCEDFWRFRPDNFLVRLDKLAPADCRNVKLDLARNPDPLREDHFVPEVVSVPAFAAPYPGGRMSSQEMRAALQARIQAAEERLWFKRSAAP